MNALVLLIIIKRAGKEIKCEALPSILSVFSNEFNKFNNTEHECKILFLIWHLFRILLANDAPKRRDFAIRKRDVSMDVNTCY